MNGRLERAGIALALCALALLVATPPAAFADARDISVGGVWICRITQDASGFTSYQRATQVNQRITQVLSTPRFRTGATVVVRPFGQAATISVGDLLVMTVEPQDVAGSYMSTVDVAKQWAALLAKGLGQAMPGTLFNF